jgi:hypothetical protein
VRRLQQGPRGGEVPEAPGRGGSRVLLEQLLDRGADGRFEQGVQEGGSVLARLGRVSKKETHGHFGPAIGFVQISDGIISEPLL